MMEYIPLGKRTPEYFQSVFQEKGLEELVRLQKNQVGVTNLDHVYLYCML